MMKKYDSKYEETTPVQAWIIESDTLTIAGYLCQKANCTFRGRSYTAWFTMDIPIPNGPWKFGGLPGLILKVYDKDKLYTFECVKIEHHKNRLPIMLHKECFEYQTIDRKRLLKLQKETHEDYYKVVGMIHTGGRIPEKPGSYNALELE